MAKISYVKGSAKNTKSASHDFSHNTKAAIDFEKAESCTRAINEHWVAGGLVDLYEKSGHYVPRSETPSVER